MRTGRSNGTTAYTYTYNGGQLSQMTVGGKNVTFTYDASGNPQTVTYGGTTYYYATNLQGDVIAILNSAGTKVVSYTYDAWGNSINIAHSMASTLGTLNPLRYRGYVYDHETGLYYLQSRYYNPKVGRFINADALVSTGQGLLGNNMFAYCQNNPVVFADPSGFVIVLAANATDEQKKAYEQALCYLQRSKRASALIKTLEESEVTFTIAFTKGPTSFDYSTQTIYFNINFGVVLNDGISTQSAALGLAHEMGHASQYLNGVYRLYPGPANRLKREKINLELFEKPIAMELGEPVRNNYEDHIGVSYRSNPTHFTTVGRRSFWFYLLPWNWGKPSEYPIDHNL